MNGPERAAELAEEAALRLRAPRRFWQPDGSLDLGTRPCSRPSFTARGHAFLRRQYGGGTLEVQVVAAGFEYQNKIYASLSQLAHHVTGTRWNGYQFFGLKGEWPR